MTEPKYKIGDIVVYNNTQQKIEEAEFTNSNQWMYLLHKAGWQKESEISYKL